MALECTICKHNERGAIERMIAAGTHSRVIARSFPAVRVADFPDHRAKHMALQPSKLEPAARRQYETALMDIHISGKLHRLSKIQSIFERIEAVMTARSNDATNRIAKAQSLLEAGEQVPMGLVPPPGSETGLLKSDGVFDVYLVREYRSCLEQAAKECGEWDITGSGSREDASAGGNVTIYQSIQGVTEQKSIISADSKYAELPTNATPIRYIEATVRRDSIQSVYRDDSVIEAGELADDEVDDGPDEG